MAGCRGSPARRVRPTSLGSQQIRSPASRSQQRLLLTPARNRLMVAGEQNVRHPHAPEDRRPRILRILEQPVAERFVRRALVVT
mgnify:CR=1 FL=1